MILRHCFGLVLVSLAFLASFSNCELLDTSILSSPDYDTIKIEKRILKKTLPISSISGDVPSGAGQIGSRIDKTLGIIRSKIDEAVESVESDIAVSNRDKVILALANFLGMVFGILKATGAATNWIDVSAGNKIQVFAQILYGYGYWGPFALEYEASNVDCGIYDFENALSEYGYVTDYYKANLDPAIATYFTTELNGAIKEKLYCLISRASGNQEANELDTYVNVYTQLLSEKIEAH